MASKCELTGKGKMFGHNVSFSQRRTKRVFKPNLQKKTLTVDGKKVTMTLSTQAIRTLRKKGLIKKYFKKIAQKSCNLFLSMI